MTEELNTEPTALVIPKQKQWTTAIIRKVTLARLRVLLPKCGVDKAISILLDHSEMHDNEIKATV